MGTDRKQNGYSAESTDVKTVREKLKEPRVLPTMKNYIDEPVKEF